MDLSPSHLPFSTFETTGLTFPSPSDDTFMVIIYSSLLTTREKLGGSSNIILPGEVYDYMCHEQPVFKKYKKLLLQHNNSIILQSFIRKFLLSNKYFKYKYTILTLQSNYRRIKAKRKRYRKLKSKRSRRIWLRRLRWKKRGRRWKRPERVLQSWLDLRVAQDGVDFSSDVLPGQLGSEHHPV